MTRRRVSYVAAVAVLLILMPGWSARGGDAACSKCGPGVHWLDSCAAGPDSINNMSALVGLDLDLDPLCGSDTTVPVSGPVAIQRSAPLNISVNFPSIDGPPGHVGPDVIDTEIVSMTLTGGGMTLRAGAGSGVGGLGSLVQATKGVIEETTSDPALADSFFDVFFELDVGGGLYVYNQTPARIQSTISCDPPNTVYIQITNCVPLYTSPTPGTGIHVANLARFEQDTNLPAEPVPTVSTWGLVIMVLLLLVGGKVYFNRRQAMTA